MEEPLRADSKFDFKTEDLFNTEPIDEALRPKLKKLNQPGVVKRRGWKANFTSGMGAIDPLDFPLDQVIITHTESSPCGNLEECTDVLRGVQELFMQMGYHDIPYNFIVTTEGDMFEGRAWVDECPLPFCLGNQSKSLVIGIIGRKIDCYGKAEEAINEKINEIIDHGLQYELIKPNFVKREIESWHYRNVYTKEYILKEFPEINPELLNNCN